MVRPISEKMTNTATLTQTTVDPVGDAKINESKSPMAVQETDTIAAQTVTERKLLKRRIAEREGKMIRAEIRSAPTISIDMTMRTPAEIAKSEL